MLSFKSFPIFIRNHMFWKFCRSLFFDILIYIFLACHLPRLFLSYFGSGFFRLNNLLFSKFRQNICFRQNLVRYGNTNFSLMKSVVQSYLRWFYLNCYNGVSVSFSLTLNFIGKKCFICIFKRPKFSCLSETFSFLIRCSVIQSNCPVRINFYRNIVHINEFIAFFIQRDGFSFFLLNLFPTLMPSHGLTLVCLDFRDTLLVKIDTPLDRYFMSRKRRAHTLNPIPRDKTGLIHGLFTFSLADGFMLGRYLGNDRINFCIFSRSIKFVFSSIFFCFCINPFVHILIRCFRNKFLNLCWLSLGIPGDLNNR